jgi:hypothetical protein
LRRPSAAQFAKIREELVGRTIAVTKTGKVERSIWKRRAIGFEISERRIIQDDEARECNVSNSPNGTSGLIGSAAPGRRFIVKRRLHNSASRPARSALQP